MHCISNAHGMCTEESFSTATRYFSHGQAIIERFQHGIERFSTVSLGHRRVIEHDVEKEIQMSKALRKEIACTTLGALNEDMLSRESCRTSRAVCRREKIV
jgi:hypothetical protein